MTTLSGYRAVLSFAIIIFNIRKIYQKIIELILKNQNEMHTFVEKNYNLKIDGKLDER